MSAILPLSTTIIQSSFSGNVKAPDDEQTFGVDAPLEKPQSLLKAKKTAVYAREYTSAVVGGGIKGAVLGGAIYGLSRLRSISTKGAKGLSKKAAKWWSIGAGVATLGFNLLGAQMKVDQKVFHYNMQLEKTNQDTNKKSA